MNHVALIALLLVLVACGGGGGGKSQSAPAEEIDCSAHAEETNCMDGLQDNGYAVADIVFVNTWEQAIGEIIVIDGAWCPESELPMSGDSTIVTRLEMGRVEPGKTGEIRFLVWSDYVTIYVRFLRYDGTLTDWLHPMKGGYEDQETGTFCKSAFYMFVPGIVFTETLYYSFTYTYHTDPTHSGKG